MVPPSQQIDINKSRHTIFQRSHTIQDLFFGRLV